MTSVEMASRKVPAFSTTKPKASRAMPVRIQARKVRSLASCVVRRL